MAANPDPRAIHVDPTGNNNTQYYGLAAIGSRFNVSAMTILNWHRKIGFPILTVPASKPQSVRGWRYYSDEVLILRWLERGVDLSRVRSLRQAGARRDTVRERCIRRGRPVPAEHAQPGDAVVSDPQSTNSTDPTSVSVLKP